MPGTIQVSVLDFKGLSSSSPPLSLSIKVSMGKREYQTCDNGDFSFPLTNVRDKLIVTLQDAEGNHISHTGVQTMLIVEKGLWEDLFPLEGGGHVRLKLQFILSNEERNRIRIMRESALRKKLGAGTGSSIESSMAVHHEVSDSQTSVAHNEAVSTGDAAVQTDPLSTPKTFCEDLQSTDGSREGSSLKQITPNASDRSEETSSSPLSLELEVHPSEVHHRALVENIESQLPHADVLTTPALCEEVSSLPVCTEPVAAKDESVSPMLEYDPVDKPDQKGQLEKIPNNTMKLKEPTSSAPSSQGIEIRHMALVKTIKTQLPQEVSSTLGFSKSVGVSKSKSVFPKLEDDAADKLEKQGPLEKTPNNVKKMINAFESSRTQDRRPPIIALATRPQSSKVGIEVPLKDQSLKNITKLTEFSSETLKTPSLIGGSQQSPIKILNTGQHSGFDKDLDGSKPSQSAEKLFESSSIYIESTRTDASIENKFKSAHKEMNTNEESKSPEDLLTQSTSETDAHSPEGQHINIMPNSEFDGSKPTQVTKQLLESSSANIKSTKTDESVASKFKADHKELDTKEEAKTPADLMTQSANETDARLGIMHNPEGQPINFRDEQQESVGTSAIEGIGREVHSNDLREISIQGAENDNLKSVADCEDKHNTYESSGAWLFPGDTRHLCITTGGKEVTELSGGCGVEPRRHQGDESSFVPENVGKHRIKRGADSEMGRGQQKNWKVRKSRTESSGDDASTGPVGKAIKIAIVVGFGILVLLTRQRETRKNNRKENYPFFTTPVDIDQEEWEGSKQRKIHIPELP